MHPVYRAEYFKDSTTDRWLNKSNHADLQQDLMQINHTYTFQYMKYLVEKTNLLSRRQILENSMQEKTYTAKYLMKIYLDLDR